MSAAADRIQAFLDQRQQMRGLDKNEVISANGYGFSEADLQELVDIARKSEGGVDG